LRLFSCDLYHSCFPCWTTYKAMAPGYGQVFDDENDDDPRNSVDDDYSDGGFNSIGSDMDSEDGNEHENGDDDDEEDDEEQSLDNRFQAMNFRSSNAAPLNLCVVCHKRPPYSKGGKSFPTCGLTCAAKYTPRAFGTSSRSHSSRSSATGQHHSGGHHSGGRGRVLICVICNVKPCYSKGSRTYITCGLTCAAQLCAGAGDPTKCNYCHRKPRFKNYPQCGKTCRDKASVACLMCRCRPRHGKYHLCGRTCKSLAVKSTPLILEAPVGHATFKMVQDKFKKAWHSPPGQACPEIKRVYKIIENGAFLNPYDRYRQLHGNEHFRYHGTSRQCTLGNPGNTKLCTSTSCALCSILRTSFKVSLANAGGAFGKGVYSSSASNKAMSYSTNGAMLVTKVVLGKVRTVSAFNEVMSLPPGFNSVVFDRMNGQLNETIVYDDNAIRPVFLLIF